MRTEEISCTKEEVEDYARFRKEAKILIAIDERSQSPEESGKHYSDILRAEYIEHCYLASYSSATGVKLDELYSQEFKTASNYSLALNRKFSI